MSNVDRLNQKRNQLMLRLEKMGIATRQGTHAPVIQGYYRSKYGFQPGDFPNAYMADRLSLALPMFMGMTEEEQSYVLDALAG